MNNVINKHILHLMTNKIYSIIKNNVGSGKIEYK